MKISHRLFRLFTPIILLLSGGSFVLFCHTLNWLYLLTFFFSLYGLPLITYRLHQLLIPIEEGISYLDETSYSPWFVSYQIQYIYLYNSFFRILFKINP